METAVLVADVNKAHEQARLLRKHLHKRADEEYESLLRINEAVVAGKTLIDLRKTMIMAGLDQENLPRLAIARADKKRVNLFWRNRMWNQPLDGYFEFDCRSPREHKNLGRYYELPFVLEKEPDWGRRHALVPLIPPEVRPLRINLANHHILWEVEKWEKPHIPPRAPYDPLLLSHVVGEIYAIMGHWDLTDLERAVMEGRLS